MVVSHTKSRNRLFEFESWLFQLPAVCSWPSSLTFLYLCFLICKMGTVRGLNVSTTEHTVICVCYTHTYIHTVSQSGVVPECNSKRSFKSVIVILNIEVWCRNSLSKGTSRWKSCLEITWAT